ncbi:MAG: LD-carboxypeptidase [Myxococcales bacterium]|jgi:muramoyltetrapeptide carboxypeptidase|nr:LD-carboxypeptidase [Myxococcales bacterium]
MSSLFCPAPALAPGDVVSVIAPSSPFDRAAFDRGLQRLSERYRPRLAPDLFACERYLAGSDARRLQALNEALADAESRAIFCARGGYGAMRLLPGLKLPETPKVLVGFSDITALHAALQVNGWRSLHGPVLTQLGRLDEAMARALFDCLESGTHLPRFVGEAVVPGVVEGPVLGGNLSVLTRLIGTPFLPALDGAILFLEDVGERPYRLDRMLQHLALAGGLARVAGVALGDFTDCDDEHLQLRGAAFVREELARQGVPCVAGLRVGHGLDNWPLPLGARARLDGAAGTLCFVEGVVE